MNKKSQRTNGQLIKFELFQYPKENNILSDENLDTNGPS